MSDIEANHSIKEKKEPLSPVPVELDIGDGTVHKPS